MYKTMYDITSFKTYTMVYIYINIYIIIQIYILYTKIHGNEHTRKASEKHNALLSGC